MESKDFKNKSFKASGYYKKKDFEKAYEIYNKLYEEDYEKFGFWEKTNFGWCIYRLYCKECNEDTEEKVELITKISTQQDRSKEDGPCIYSLSILNLADYLINISEFEEALKWLERINPAYLNSKNDKFTSNLEKYYTRKSKALLKTEEYEACIEVCKEALEKLDGIYENGIWFKYRIANAQLELLELDEALELLKEVAEEKKEWYVYKQIAEVYFQDFELDEALKYAIHAALINEKIEEKVNLYLLLARIFKEKELNKYAIKHYYLTYLIQTNKEWNLDDEVKEVAEEENFSDNEDYKVLESELRDFWESYSS